LNAAFVLDVLAAQEDEEAARAGVSSSTAAERRAHARLIREELARSVPPLRDQPGCGWIRDEWWYYPTVGTALFGLRRYEEAVRSSFRGKFGLALSGGGLRASLYHVGVLARLAELDVLRHVEVLSCVSGGSILGAHYYLEVRRLLPTKADDEITREDYIEIVRRLEERFLRGVQRNIRTRVLAQ